jgi:hypothetical protein
LGAGASPGAISAAILAYEAWERAERPRGRQRKHADTAAAKRAWYQKSRAKKPAVPSDETTERPRYALEPDGRNLRVRLVDASNGNIDPLSDISPIRSLIEQGAEELGTVA